MSSRLRAYARLVGESARWLLRGDLQASFRAARAAAGWLRCDVAAALRERDDVVCEICGWQGRRFYLLFNSGVLRENAQCPRCGSLERHRRLFRFLRTRADLGPGGCRVLFIAPFEPLARWLHGREGARLYTLDIRRGRGGIRGDIQRLAVRSEAVDFVLCSHVLEHVPDDVAGLREIARALRPGGKAVIQVPVRESLPETIEYGQERRDVSGHRRHYGADFGKRMEEAGLRISVDRSLYDLDPEEAARFGLAGKAPIFVGEKVSS